MGFGWSVTACCRALALCTALAGCATAPVSVSVPIAVSCVPADAPAPPATRSNAELASLDDRQLVLTIASERLTLLGYARQADAVIQGCR